MPVPEKYKTKYWFQTPEPSCRPGYTGFLPGYGPKRLFQFAKTYGMMTHELMKEHPVAGLRLGNLLDNSLELQRKLEEEAMTWKHEVTAENNRYCRNMVPGYTGYVPRKKFLVGRVYDEECKEAVALFEKLKLMNL
ncbi:protein FAM166B-like [Stegodyphus dumicola]|uniref:protein FAM166B-like n=1 Tax=Stegodyphus dumicola TaxID=202533 RepID=UPI0015AEF1E5|nr:protein FAM166B-like [Stegodyphus dumicola]